jgi:hypothetical protein
MIILDLKVPLLRYPLLDGGGAGYGTVGRVLVGVGEALRTS